MIPRTYPYTAWVLTPSFKLKQVELVKAFSGNDYCDLTEAGKLYGTSEIHSSIESAISFGRESLKRQRIDLNKKLGNWSKKLAALNAAEKEKS
jgi:outer membrane receptor for monomeric catechols